MSVLEEIRANLVPGNQKALEGNISLGFDPEEEYLRNVINQVVVGNSDGVKVSTSIMIYGPPGCGKSKFVDKVIRKIFLEQKNINPFEVVMLDGGYCFSLQDSVREIWQQLIDDPNTLNDLGCSENEPFDERLEKILIFLKDKLIEKKRSLVFVIDGMEKFTDDSSQRLLYNLFDMSANSVFSVPICIIGVTPCVDILDSFEKRVRSRFSHRQINLVPKSEFPQYQIWAEQLLLSKNDNQQWNSHVQEVLKDKDVLKTLRSVFEADKSIGHLQRFLYYTMLLSHETLTPAHVKEAFEQLYGIQCHIQMALDFSLSELVVLLGIFKKIQRSQQAWQPAEIYEIIKKPYSLYQLRKEDFIKTIIKLQDLELIVPVGGSKQSRTNVYESYFKCEISYLEFQEIWKNYPNLPSFFNEFL